MVPVAEISGSGSWPTGKVKVTRKRRRLLIFPSISHLEVIGQGGISREIPPWYFPDNTGPPTSSQCYGTCLQGTGEVEAPASSRVYQAVGKQNYQT